MVERKPNEVKIVAWLMVAKGLIKFANDEQNYKLADAVLKANDFSKFPLSKGDKVEVGMKDGVITFLRKQKSESKGSEEAYEPTPEEQAPKSASTPAPKAEAPKLESPNVVGEMKELTVYAIATNKKVVKFLENKDEGWFQIDESIQAKDYEVIGLKAKNRFKVQIVNNKVIALEKVAVEAPQTAQEAPSQAKTEPASTTTEEAPKAVPTAKKEWKPYSAQGKDDYWSKKSEFDQAHYDVKESEKQISIESQAAVNSANEVVGRIAANIEPKPTSKVINDMIRAIAESNYALIQELKKK
jgi:hypothetical protein